MLCRIKTPRAVRAKKGGVSEGCKMIVGEGGERGGGGMGMAKRKGCGC